MLQLHYVVIKNLKKLITALFKIIVKAFVLHNDEYVLEKIVFHNFYPNIRIAKMNIETRFK